MSKLIKYLNRICVFVVLVGFCLIPADAKIVSHSKDIIVEQPGDLPELARRAGITLQLYSESGNGNTYLYIEQHRGERLLVLDVTDPAHTKMVAAVPLAVPGPFDFVGPLGNSAMMLQFRSNHGVAILNLRNPKAPTLSIVNGLHLIGITELLGESRILMVDAKGLDGQPVAHDYQVVDTSVPESPILLHTVKLVTDKTTRELTGTTFLLGSEGLTIIRRPGIEREYEIQQDGMEN